MHNPEQRAVGRYSGGMLVFGEQAFPRYDWNGELVEWMLDKAHIVNKKQVTGVTVFEGTEWEAAVWVGADLRGRARLLTCLKDEEQVLQEILSWQREKYAGMTAEEAFHCAKRIEQEYSLVPSPLHLGTTYCQEETPWHIAKRYEATLWHRYDADHYTSVTDFEAAVRASIEGQIERREQELASPVLRSAAYTMDQREYWWAGGYNTLVLRGTPLHVIKEFYETKFGATSEPTPGGVFSDDSNPYEEIGRALRGE